jgi:hypothetical protein
MFHVQEQFRVTSGALPSSSGNGNNGVFEIKIKETYAVGKSRNVTLFCIASDGMGWEHLSVHAAIGNSTFTPSWDMMCMVKNMFWNDEDTVVQFHPPKSTYVNNHPNVLHLWRKIDLNQPLPDPIMVGIKSLNR